MLLQLGVNQDLVKCHSLASTIPGSGIVWNGSRYELILESKAKIKLWAALIASGALLYGLNARAAWKSGDVGMSIFCGLLSFIAAAVAASSLSFRENGSDCASFLNGLLSVASDWKQDQSFQAIVRPEALVTLLMRMMVTSQLVYPWLLSLVALCWPCSSLNMFSSLIGWCGGSVNASCISRMVSAIGTGALHVVFHKALLSQGGLDFVHIFLGSLCQNSLLQFTSNHKHPGSEEFPCRQLKLYQSCQILNTCFSNYCTFVGLAMLSTTVAGEVVTTYLFLKILGGSSNLLFLVKAMLIAICPCFFLIHLMAGDEAARVNTYSTSFLLTMGRRLQASGVGLSKLGRLQLRAAWPIKIKLGECNFIEANTNLVMLDFTLRRVVDLLLIKG